MTPQEQIAYVRARIDTFETVESNAAIRAVCDLAERALVDEQRAGVWEAHDAAAFERMRAEVQRFRLSDDEAEAVRAFQRWGGSNDWPEVKAVLRRLLGEAG
jgi:hypothetical protein